MAMLQQTWTWNVGHGTAQERALALIYCALDHENVITRHVCREILAHKITELPCKKTAHVL